MDVEEDPDRAGLKEAGLTEDEEDETDCSTLFFPVKEVAVFPKFNDAEDPLEEDSIRVEERSPSFVVELMTFMPEEEEGEEENRKDI